MWQFNYKTSQNLLRQLPKGLQLIKFLGNANVQINERTLGFLSAHNLKQLYMSQTCLKNFVWSLPQTFSSYLE